MNVIDLPPFTHEAYPGVVLEGYLRIHAGRVEVWRSNHIRLSRIPTPKVKPGTALEELINLCGIERIKDG